VNDSCTVHVGDGLELIAGIRPFSVNAIVTSPPYADLRGYGGSTPGDYADWLTPFLGRWLDVLAPQGSLMLNLGRVFRDGEETPYHELTMLRARELGWRRIDTLIWNKRSAPPRGGNYLHDVHEYVYWLARDVDAFRGYAEVGERRDPETIARYGRANVRGAKDEDYDTPTRRRVTPAQLEDGVIAPKSVFECGAGSVSGLEHPAPMEYRLARRLVQLSCRPGGLVLDPFLGSGTTAVAALELGRRCIGFELDATYAAEAVDRIRGNVQLGLGATA
jgi:DNA modification methylase